ncbi:hypothetical protein FRC10_002346 [Ceratobasidium sp. 414]|nr:hypothetical protein FRC10_002346 [Ceratobasidium sp. 414]
MKARWPPSAAGSYVSSSRLASPSPASGKAPDTTDRAEAVRRASAYLGTNASRYSNTMLQKVVAQIEDPGKEIGSGPMEIETGSAPVSTSYISHNLSLSYLQALRQSARQLGLESGRQSPTGGIADACAAQGVEEQYAAAHNLPTLEQLRLVLPADNSDMEPESESQMVELGPNDSVSQRVPPIPRASLHSSHPRPIPHAPNYVHKAKPTCNAHVDSDTNTMDESDTSSGSDTEPEEETVCSLKRQRIAPMSQPHTLPPRPNQSQLHRSHTRHSPSRSHLSSALPPAPASSKLRPAPTNTSSSHNVQEPPPLSDVTAVLTWASHLAKQAGTLRHMTQANDFQLLTTVLDNLQCSHLITPTQERVQSRPQRVGLTEDNASILEAEVALTLGIHVRPRHKATLANFPGFPQHVATLAIPDLVATAIAKGAYESHETLSAMATKCYNNRWARELPDLWLQKVPPGLVGVMVHRISWARCESKVRVRPVIPADYRICNPPRTHTDLHYNKKLVKKLLPNGFHCHDFLTDIDPYEYKALAHCIAAAFCWATNSISMISHDKFYPMPLPVVAMVLTTMQHCISEWKTGRYIPKELNVNMQCKMYEAHLTGLQNYRQVKPDNLKQLQIDWFWYAVRGASEGEWVGQAQGTMAQAGAWGKGVQHGIREGAGMIKMGGEVAREQARAQPQPRAGRLVWSRWRAR